VRQLLEMVFILGLSPLALASVDGEKKDAPPTPVPVKAGKAMLTPENTTIEFTGLHAGAEPNPRIGYFNKFKGELAFDEAKSPQSATIEIETASLVTPIQKLTNHLKSPDFFDVRQYPKATFIATKIEPTVAANAPKHNVTGELTLRGEKKSLTFPAVVRVTDEGVVLETKFKLKRSDFGMNFGPDRVVDDVAVVVVVGKRTPAIEVEK